MDNNIVYVPLRGILRPINIGPYLPIFNHPNFQRLRWISQLSNARFLFPAADHSRMEHSLGVLGETLERTSFFLKRGYISEQEKRRLDGFALVHDIGQLAFSHSSESVYEKDHEDMALVFLDEMRAEIEACGLSFLELFEMFKRSDPLAEIVLNHPLGTDKFDYLYRDSINTLLSPPDLYPLDGNVLWDGERLFIENDPDIILKAQELKRLYALAYGECYLNGKIVLIQRMVEKMWEYAFNEGASKDEMVRISDMEAITFFRDSSNKILRSLAEKYANSEIPPTVLILKAYGPDDGADTFNLPENTLRKMNKKFSSPFERSKAEKKIEKILGMPPASILLCPSFLGWRMLKKDIWVSHRKGYYEIEELYPHLAFDVNALERHYTAWRIGVIDERYRETVRAKAEEIVELLLE